jgi:hypothetical protein
MIDSASKEFRLAPDRLVQNFFKLHCAPTDSPTKQIFLREEIIPNDKQFAVFPPKVSLRYLKEIHLSDLGVRLFD